MPCLSLASARADDRRICGRLRTEQLETELGRVVNLSGSGMRLLTRQSFADRVGETLDITLSAINEETTVRVKIVWARRAGFRKHLTGLRFIDLAKDNRNWLTNLARTAVFLPGLGNQNVAQLAKAKAS